MGKTEILWNNFGFRHEKIYEEILANLIHSFNFIMQEIYEEILENLMSILGRFAP